MSGKPVSGIRIIEQSDGNGPAVRKGDSVEFESQGFLSRGECVQERMLETIQIGKRRFIAGIELALLGMKPGGYRKVRISPHLAYRNEGVPGRIPANAVLIYELWVKKIEHATSPPAPQL